MRVHSALTTLVFVSKRVATFDIDGFTESVSYRACCLGSQDQCTSSACAFQRLRNGQGPQPRHIHKCENNMEIIWPGILQKYDFWGPDLGSEAKHVIKMSKNHMKMWKECELGKSHYSHIFVAFWGSGPRYGPQLTFFARFLVISFSYYLHILVYAWAWAPVHSAIFERDSLSGSGYYQAGPSRHTVMQSMVRV